MILAPFHRCLRQIALALSCSVLASIAPALAELRIDKVFGPETPTGRYKHPSTLTELDNGDLFVAYYGGGGEYETETAVFGARRPHGKNEWTAPVVLARNPIYSMGNPVLWQAPDGRVWLFFVIRPGETWSTSRIGAKVSDDRGAAWSDAFMITFDEGTMVRSRPIVLSDGHYLLPIYHETGADTEFTAPDTGSVFLRFDPAAKQWSRSEKVLSRMGNLQAAAVEIEPGRLLALCRRGGDYEPGNDGFVVRTESRDGGKSWSPGVETEFPNPNASVELIKLQSGHLLFIYNHSMNDRSPLRAVLSTDGGKTWPRQLDLASGPGSFSYPTAVQTRDGTIHVTFTSDERTVIRHATFEESDVK
ncbi:MAG: exo-alpha-sialidase [Verrucomicrobiales bacterium]